ncbi:hypothetical protein RND71_025710 [Anisodus tanguticus]|uniref:Uncharacterized protein n=1 Tax=Anisodus tanguticus TaxID=243964 RepID=A0AAE1VCV8_9SOLA|nr:hypothetical protein RND71_025710 [Anisodus tanguticus]
MRLSLCWSFCNWTMFENRATDITYKENSGWADLAGRIQRFADKRSNQSRILQKSFVDTTIVPKWNDSEISLSAEVMKVDSKSLMQRRKYMNTCLLATVEGCVDHNFNTPEFKVWARKSWKLSYELNIVEMGRGQSQIDQTKDLVPTKLVGDAYLDGSGVEVDTLTVTEPEKDIAHLEKSQMVPFNQNLSKHGMEKEGTICLNCGDKGFTNAYVFCVKCLEVPVYR